MQFPIRNLKSQNKFPVKKNSPTSQLHCISNAFVVASVELPPKILPLPPSHYLQCWLISRTENERASPPSWSSKEYKLALNGTFRPRTHTP